MEIEYVSAPLDIDFLEGAAAAAAGDDEEMPAAGGLGLGLGAQPAAGAQGGDQPPADPAAELQRILQRFGTVEELMGTAPVEGEEEEEGGAGAGLGGAAGALGCGRGNGGCSTVASAELLVGWWCSASVLRRRGGLMFVRPHVTAHPTPPLYAGGEADDEGEGVGGGGGRGGGEAGEDSEGEEDGELSKKKRKLARRLKITELKQSCERPDVVEIWDVTAMDPKMLVYLKVG